jgi:hypothetical protein
MYVYSYELIKINSFREAPYILLNRIWWQMFQKINNKMQETLEH